MLKADYEFELTDIFEEYTDLIIKNNIKYIMKREGLWKQGMNVIFPVGAYEYDGIEDFYQKDFEIFAEDLRTILYHGTAYGNRTRAINEIIDMTIELKRFKK